MPGYEERCDHGARYYGCVVPPQCGVCRNKRDSKNRSCPRVQIGRHPESKSPPIGAIAENLLSDIGELVRSYDIKRSEVERMVDQRITGVLWEYAMDVALAAEDPEWQE